MKLILLGPAGAGKGTLAAYISRKCGIPSISTGDLFRETAAQDTTLARKVRDIMERGDLVPDDITVGMLEERLERGDTGRGFILDGFPRTLQQAEALSAVTDIDAVLNLVISDEAVIRRLAGRRICSKCGAVYHVDNMPPEKPGVCDKCGLRLVTRDDDKPEAIRNRLAVYTEKTKPLVSYYRERGLLVDVDAGGTPEEVFALAQKALEQC